MGGEPTRQPDTVVIDGSPQEMLEDDREQERAAIALYRRIIDVAEREGDGDTAGLFRGILQQEESHFRQFSDLLEGE